MGADRVNPGISRTRKAEDGAEEDESASTGNEREGGARGTLDSVEMTRRTRLRTAAGNGREPDDGSRGSPKVAGEQEGSQRAWSFGKGNLFVLARNDTMSEALVGGDGMVQIAIPDTEERVGGGAELATARGSAALATAVGKRVEAVG